MDANVVARKYFWVAPGLLVALAAFLNAQAVTQLVGTALDVDAKDLSKAPNVARHGAGPSSSARETSGKPILQRNVFDHVTGDLSTSPAAMTEESSEGKPADVSDPMNAPACDGVNVRAIVASTDEDWSFAAVAGNDGKTHLARRGSEVAGKTLYFVGWDRVWFTHGGSLCQQSLFAKPTAPPPPAPAPASSAPSKSNSRTGAPPISADLKAGIQQVSPTEYNIDRGTLDKVLENQADLMRQARIVPVQENGKTVGVKLNGVKADSLLGTIGLQNGDTLKTINGFEMGSPEKALEAYARLRTAPKITIAIDRGGKPMNMDYNIK
jgi:general secretion pathway protein C